MEDAAEAGDGVTEAPLSRSSALPQQLSYGRSEGRRGWIPRRVVERGV